MEYCTSRVQNLCMRNTGEVLRPLPPLTYNRAPLYRRGNSVAMLVVLFLLCSGSLCAQESPVDSTPPSRVNLDACAGYSVRMVGDAQRITGLDYSFGGVAGALRLMWQPEYRLAVGLEIGYFPVTSVGADSSINEARIGLSAVPVFAMTTMRFGNAEVMGGIGAYSYAVDGTSIKRFGVAESALEIGYTLGVGYTYGLFSRFGVGGEVRLYQFTDRPITVIMPALRLRTAIYEY